MDAVKYLEERQRMCKQFNDCNDCPFDEDNNGKDEACISFDRNYPKEAVSIIEKWSKENPVVTNEMKYREVMEKTFGVEIVGRGECPPFRTGCIESCNECTKWWSEEYKAPEREEE